VTCTSVICFQLFGSHLRIGAAELISAYKTSVAFNKSSAVADMGDRLATVDMGRKVGRTAVGDWVPIGSHLTQCGLGRGLPLYQVAS